MISLDHIGVIGHSITKMRKAWMDAGFFVTEPEELMALEPGTGKRVSLGQHSCHVVLERGYIELTAVDRVSPTHHLGPWITPGVSLGILALGADDIEKVHQRLVAAQIPVGPLAQASRPIHYGSRRGDALFTWFALDAQSTPEALVCFVRNERPELVYQPEVQAHRNGAKSLEAILISANDPATAAARYAPYGVIKKIESDLLCCQLDEGALWFGRNAALASQFGGGLRSVPDGTPRCVGFVISAREQGGAETLQSVHWVVNESPLN